MTAAARSTASKGKIDVGTIGVMLDNSAFLCRRSISVTSVRTSNHPDQPDGPG